MSKIVEYTKKDFENKITENFKVKEFACKDGSEILKIDIELVDTLQKIREAYNTPIKIVSGYRTEAYNNRCGGAKKSKHLTGEAIDFYFMNSNKFDNKNIMYIADDINTEYKIKGIGVYINRPQNYIHIDNRAEQIIWINNIKNNKQSYYKSMYDYLLDIKPYKEVMFG